MYMKHYSKLQTCLHPRPGPRHRRRWASGSGSSHTPPDPRSSSRAPAGGTPPAAAQRWSAAETAAGSVCQGSRWCLLHTLLLTLCWQMWCSEHVSDSSAKALIKPIAGCPLHARLQLAQPPDACSATETCLALVHGCKVPLVALQLLPFIPYEVVQPILQQYSSIHELSQSINNSLTLSLPSHKT